MLLSTHYLTWRRKSLLSGTPCSITSVPPRKNMAAVSLSDSATSQPTNVVIKIKSEADDELFLEYENVAVKRDPVVPLLAPVSGLQPLAWSQDHRLSVCTASSLSLMELVCDVHSNKQDLTLHRTSIPVPTDPFKLRVNVHKAAACGCRDSKHHLDILHILDQGADLLTARKRNLLHNS